MKQPSRLARLTDSEAVKVRALTEKHGAPKTARMLGLCDVRTLYKALAQVDVHPLTASTVRANLANKL